jgi:hypothetical protein
MRISNVLPGVFILILSAAVFFETRHLPYWTETAPGAAFFPLWLVAAGVALFVLQMLEGKRMGRESVAQWPDRAALLRAVLTYGGLAGMALLAPLLGMLTTALLFMAFLLIVILRRPLWPSLATVVITAALVYVIFVQWLGVALPTFSLGA